MLPRSLRSPIAVAPGRGVTSVGWRPAAGVTAAPTCQATACGSFRTVIVRDLKPSAQP